VGASVVVLILTFLMFWRGFIGGGDAKLIPATALLIGYHDLLNFLVLMGICGVLVSVAILITPQPSQPQPKARSVVPYGVAIAGGGIVTLIFQSSFIG
jgi:prepilin peptidase CpaA